MLDNIPYCAVRHRTYYDFKPYGLKNLPVELRRNIGLPQITQMTRIFF